VIAGTVYYLWLTAPVQVSTTPPVAPTLAVASNPTPARAVSPTAPPTADLTPNAPATRAETPQSAFETPAGASNTAQVYRIDPTQSEASYSVEETFFQGNRLFTAVGRTNAVAGDILMDRANLAASQIGEIVVDISQLETDSPQRDNAIRNAYLESARYPLATFKNATISDIPPTWAEGQLFAFKMTGDMTVRDITQPITWDVQATLERDVLRGEATTQIKMSQFGVEPPRLATLAVEDDMVLTLRFVANAVETGTTSETATPSTGAAGNTSCEPTRSDAEGPFYVPGAPERTSVGQGHILSGTVKSSKDCSPIPLARIEVWMAGPNGQYDDEHRATMLSSDLGLYRFESNPPPSYGGRPPHIHIKVTAEGYRQLTTQYYAELGDTEGTFDLVLVPEGQ
jgi:polyisoprenoid-binding protein YceI